MACPHVRGSRDRAFCVFGCSLSAEDSILHYAHCNSFHGLCGRALHLAKPPFSSCLNDFLCLLPNIAGLPAALQDGDAFTAAVCLRALSVYGLARVHSACRHGTVQLRGVPDAFCAFIQEGVRAAPKALSLIAAARARRGE